MAQLVQVAGALLTTEMPDLYFIWLPVAKDCALFPLLVLKGIYHHFVFQAPVGFEGHQSCVCFCWSFFSSGLKQMEVPSMEAKAFDPGRKAASGVLRCSSSLKWS